MNQKQKRAVTGPAKGEKMNVFISSDIEGTCGICDWSEISKGGSDYERFAEQMSREAAAACEGAGPDAEIMVRDGHGSARNIIPSLLPDNAVLMRGWEKSPDGMMAGISTGFDACAMVGYHAHAYSTGNPLAHTSEPNIQKLLLNGEYCSEFRYNAYFAAYYGVPTIFISGDADICREAKELIPSITAVPVLRSHGGASISIQPERALQLIREGMARAMTGDLRACLPRLPEHFCADIEYKEYQDAEKFSYYPGAKRLDAKTVRFEADDYYEVKRFFMFAI